jgi:dTDP-4-dehydrorhamnose reductase
LGERGHEVVGTYATTPYLGLTHIDAADLTSAANWLRAQRPAVVLYPAGFTWVDGCERDPARAAAANIEQPLNLARAARDAGAMFVYFSTDYVFDGKHGPYSEDSPTNPLSVYGRSKCDAEVVLAATMGDRGLIVRTSWVFGPERQGKNFAYQLVRTLSAGKELACPSDQFSNPSYGPNVARAVVQLVEQGRAGLVHLAGPELLDRIAFARAIARGFALDPELIVPRKTAELGQTAARPLNGGLLTTRLDAWLPGAMRPLSECIDDFRARLAEPEGWAQPVS